MTYRQYEREFKPITGAVFVLAGAATAALVLGLAMVASPRPADALPSYAQQTGLACGRCHVNPAGGGARTAFGKAFAANGHKVPAGAKGGTKSAAGGAPAAPVAVSSSVVLDRAQAQAWSLREPYYSHFLYSPCDYGSCWFLQLLGIAK
jgi:hypothetical protein